MKSVTLIVPCYNEADVLTMLLKELTRVTMPLSGQYCFKFLFVNDGSSDATLDIVKSFAERSDAIQYISFSRNFGKEAAMLAGMKYADSDFIGLIDADLQHSPDLIPEMLQAVDSEGYDVAAACRTDRVGESKLKSMLSAQFYKVINRVSEIRINDNAQDFRIMRRKVVDAILSMPESIRFSKGIFSWVGFRVKWFPHENRERAAGETKWSIKKLAKYAIDGILGYTSSPLRLPLYLGVVSCFAACILALYGLIRFCMPTADFPMYALLLAAILFMSGIVLCCVGLIGEYLARVYTETKRRPPFIISESNINNIRVDHQKG